MKFSNRSFFNAKVVAEMPLLAGFSIQIMEVENGIEDEVHYKFSDSNLVYKATLGIGPDGNNYFEHDGEHYDIEDFIRL